MTDPFKPDDSDPFKQRTRSIFPKPEDLEGSLIMFMPTKPAEMVTNKFYKKEGDATHVARFSVDTIVFGPDGIEQYDDMYWSQTAIIGACEQALKPGAKPFVLGRLVKIANKDTKEALKISDSPEEFAAAREAWFKNKGKGYEPKHVWVLAEFDESDAKRAREYIASRQKQTDPFAAAPAE